MPKTLRRKNILLAVLLLVAFVSFLFYLGLSLRQNKKIETSEESESAETYTSTDTELIDNVLEDSLLEFFKESNPEYAITDAKREISKEQISNLTNTYRYTLGGEEIIQQKAVYISEVVKDRIYKFKFNYEGTEYTVDVNYDSVQKLSDADYGFDSQGTLLRAEFFPIDKANIKLLESGAVVYLIFPENQVKNVVLNPIEIVILSYE